MMCWVEITRHEKNGILQKGPKVVYTFGLPFTLSLSKGRACRRANSAVPKPFDKLKANGTGQTGSYLGKFRLS